MAAQPRPRTNALGFRHWMWIVKPAVYLVGAIPAAWFLYLAVIDALGADPLRELERGLGLWSLRLLVLGLAFTPLRRMGGPNLIRYRRAVGLLAFFYAALHFMVYIVLDQGLDIVAIGTDILKRPYITVGLVAFVILVPLAVTSNAIMIRRLGGAAWQRLHRWVYLAALAAALHFIMLVKSWSLEPLAYAGLVIVLLSLRLPLASGRGATRVARSRSVLDHSRAVEGSR